MLAWTVCRCPTGQSVATHSGWTITPRRRTVFSLSSKFLFHCFFLELAFYYASVLYVCFLLWIYVSLLLLLVGCFLLSDSNTPKMKKKCFFNRTITATKLQIFSLHHSDEQILIFWYIHPTKNIKMERFKQFKKKSSVISWVFSHMAFKLLFCFGQLLLCGLIFFWTRFEYIHRKEKNEKVKKIN